MKNLLLIILLFIVSACNNSLSKRSDSPVPLPDKNAFHQIVNGKETNIYFIANKNHLTATITNYGARLVNLFVPDKNRKFIDVVLGFDSLNQYLNAKGPYFGATIGRYANRIAKGSFNLNGNSYQLKINNGENILHGGSKGFNTQVWNVTEASKNFIKLNYLSLDGEEGFPGNLNVSVTYFLSDKNELKISYTATTDKATVVNFTNHSFFNLNGENSGDISNQLLTINADKFTPVNKSLIVTGELQSVENTPFDFRKPIAIGAHINDTNLQLQYAGGYDHNFVLNKTKNEPLNFAAKVYSPISGITMQVFTDQPGLQFFTSNAFKGLDIGKHGKPINYRSAFCLETQHFPNSPNNPSLPTTVLNSGDAFNSTTIYKFSTN